VPTLYDPSFYAIAAALELGYYEVPKKVSTLKPSENFHVPLTFEEHLDGTLIKFPIGMEKLTTSAVGPRWVYFMVTEPSSLI